MLAAFGHIAKQCGSHPHPARPTEIDPHLADRMLRERSARDDGKRCTIGSFGKESLSEVCTEFAEESLTVSRSMQIREDTPIEPGHRLNPARIATQEFLSYRNAVVMCD